MMHIMRHRDTHYTHASMCSQVPSCTCMQSNAPNVLLSSHSRDMGRLDELPSNMPPMSPLQVDVCHRGTAPMTTLEGHLPDTHAAFRPVRCCMDNVCALKLFIQMIVREGWQAVVTTLTFVIAWPSHKLHSARYQAYGQTTGCRARWNWGRWHRHMKVGRSLSQWIAVWMVLTAVEWQHQPPNITCFVRFASAASVTSAWSYAYPRVGWCNAPWWNLQRAAPSTLTAASLWTARQWRWAC